MSKKKELNFFVDSHEWGNWSKGVKWYESQFLHGGNSIVRGESSVAYTRWDIFRSSVVRASSLLKECKIIYIVRNPIDRLVSNYCHLLHDQGWPDINEAICLEDILKGGPSNQSTGYYYKIMVFTGLYWQIIKKYIEYFGEDNVLIVGLSNLSSQPLEVLEDVSNHVNVPFRKEYYNTNNIYNMSSDNRIQVADPLRFLRQLGCDGALKSIMPQSLRNVYKVLTTKNLKCDELSYITDDSKCKLKNLYFDDVEKINNFAGKQLIDF